MKMNEEDKENLVHLVGGIVIGVVLGMVFSRLIPTRYTIHVNGGSGYMDGTRSVSLDIVVNGHHYVSYPEMREGDMIHVNMYGNIQYVIIYNQTFRYDKDQRNDVFVIDIFKARDPQGWGDWAGYYYKGLGEEFGWELIDTIYLNMYDKHKVN